jgi:hypothetical protein
MRAVGRGLNCCFGALPTSAKVLTQKEALTQKKVLTQQRVVN